jgi:hypothetical protein
VCNRLGNWLAVLRSAAVLLYPRSPLPSFLAASCFAAACAGPIVPAANVLLVPWQPDASFILTGAMGSFNGWLSRKIKKTSNRKETIVQSLAGSATAATNRCVAGRCLGRNIQLQAPLAFAVFNRNAPPAVATSTWTAHAENKLVGRSHVNSCRRLLQLEPPLTKTLSRRQGVTAARAAAPGNFSSNCATRGNGRRLFFHCLILCLQNSFRRRHRVFIPLLP